VSAYAFVYQYNEFMFDADFYPMAESDDDI